MRSVGVYEVMGHRAFRGHEPGAVFEAALDPHMETRALQRGSIRLLGRHEADLPAGKYQLPAGWHKPRKEQDDGEVHLP